MLEDLIILINDLNTTITMYWDKHPIFTSIVGGLIALRILWAVFKAAKRLLKVLFHHS
jgi:glutathionylspermidine synthase